MALRDSNHIIIEGWMRTELGLKGNDLLVYAIIYGFSQTENQRFTGSPEYLADWCGSTKQGIYINLKRLIDKGLISKEQQIINGVNYVSYLSTKFPSCKHSFSNNISNIDNTEDKQDKAIKKKLIEEDKKEEKVKREEGSVSAEAFKELYNDHCFNLPKARQLSDKRLKAIHFILKHYSIEEIIEVLDKANGSAFLTGNNDRGWVADIDFILREDKFLNILEGKYGGKKSKRGADGLVIAPRVTKEEREHDYKYKF